LARISIYCMASTLALALTANDAAACRRSCGVIVGNSGAAFRIRSIRHFRANAGEPIGVSL
jgi:hypothetical protein